MADGGADRTEKPTPKRLKEGRKQRRSSGGLELCRQSGRLDLRVIAVSRLLLDNVPHLKAYWIMLGEKTAQVGLSFGANDLDGTVVEEKIVHMAGAESPERLAVDRLTFLIREAGKTPVERDTLYNVVKREKARA